MPTFVLLGKDQEPHVVVDPIASVAVALSEKPKFVRDFTNSAASYGEVGTLLADAGYMLQKIANCKTNPKPQETKSAIEQVEKHIVRCMYLHQLLVERLASRIAAVEATNQP